MALAIPKSQTARTMPTSIVGVVHAHDQQNRTLTLSPGDVVAFNVRIQCDNFDLWHLYSHARGEIVALIQSAIEECFGGGLNYELLFERGSILAKFVGVMKKAGSYIASGAKAVVANVTNFAKTVRDGVQATWERCKPALISAYDKAIEFKNSKPGKVIITVGFCVITAISIASAGVDVANFFGISSVGGLIAMFPGSGYLFS